MIPYKGILSHCKYTKLFLLVRSCIPGEHMIGFSEFQNNSSLFLFLSKVDSDVKQAKFLSD